jgi:AAA+ superfamily predicted ATPase
MVLALVALHGASLAILLVASAAVHFGAWHFFQDLPGNAPRTTLEFLILSACLAVSGGLVAARGWRASRAGPDMAAVFIVGFGFFLLVDAATAASWALGLPVDRFQAYTFAFLVMAGTCTAYCWSAVRSPAARTIAPAAAPRAVVSGARLPPEAPTPMALPLGLEEVKDTGVRFDDLVGMEGPQRDLEEAVDLIRHPEVQKRFGIPPVRGILLHGPPGNGKTMFARAAAGSLNLRFLRWRAPDVGSEFFGQTEKHIKAIFEYARQHTPCLLFIDEVDAIAPDRSKLSGSMQYMVASVNTLLEELDGLGGGVDNPIVLAATNRKEAIDPALLRPGRIDRLIEVPLPHEAARLELLRRLVKGRPLEPGLRLEPIAQATGGFSNAQLRAVVEDAARAIYREDPTGNPRPMRLADLETALAAVRSA